MKQIFLLDEDKDFGSVLEEPFLEETGFQFTYFSSPKLFLRALAPKIDLVLLDIGFWDEAVWGKKDFAPLKMRGRKKTLILLGNKNMRPLKPPHPPLIEKPFHFSALLDLCVKLTQKSFSPKTQIQFGGFVFLELKKQLVKKGKKPLLLV